MSNKQSRLWNPEVMLSLLSPDRMATYLTSAEGDLDAAFTLYNRNIRIAMALQGMTAMVEAVVRNAIDRVLTDWNDVQRPGTDWFDLEILDGHAKADIETARRRASRYGSSEGHSKLIPELPFGFWRFLTSRRYLTSLWIPALQHAFPNGHCDILKRQSQVSSILNSVSFVRNRAAHLEPVFRRDIGRDLERSRALLGWIDVNAAAWLAENETVTAVINGNGVNLEGS